MLRPVEFTIDRCSGALGGGERKRPLLCAMMLLRSRSLTIVVYHSIADATRVCVRNCCTIAGTVCQMRTMGDIADIMHANTHLKGDV